MPRAEVAPTPSKAFPSRMVSDRASESDRRARAERTQHQYDARARWVGDPTRAPNLNAAAASLSLACIGGQVSIRSDALDLPSTSLASPPGEFAVLPRRACPRA